MAATSKKVPSRAAAVKAAGSSASTRKSALGSTLGPRVVAAPMKPLTESLTKTALVKHLADAAAVDVPSVKAVLAHLEATIVASLHKKGVGVFQWPGVFKATAVTVPARPARKGVNPFTKEEVVFAAKPASTRVRVRMLKKIQDAIK
jgi:nucleoid DNA-binding protein